MKIQPPSDLSPALRALYESQLCKPTVWSDESDHAFINNHLIERGIAQLASSLQGELIDVGCGMQPYRAYYAHATRVVACDFDGARGHVDFTCPAHAIPVEAGSFDIVFCTEVLEHVPDPDAVWREFYRVLRPGGRLLLTSPMYWPSHERPYDFYRYPEHGLRRLARETGFEVINLVPRGGVWAFLGQVILHVMPQYLRFRWQRKLLNRLFLKLDAWRNNPDITLGWTILAQKPCATSLSTPALSHAE